MTRKTSALVRVLFIATLLWLTLPSPFLGGVAAERYPDNIWLGPPEAKVHVIYYGSFTCGHCGEIFRASFSEIKKKYVDPGLIRFSYVSFSLDQQSTVATLATYCAKREKYYELVESFYVASSQQVIFRTPIEELIKLVLGFVARVDGVPSGVNPADCLLNQVPLVKQKEEEARELYAIYQVPTVIINGEKLEQPKDWNEIEKHLQTALSK